MSSVLEDSLDSGASLARAWLRGLGSPQLTIAQVAEGPERRLLTNLRVLAVRDPDVTKNLLSPALDDDDAHRRFVAALVLLEGGENALPAVLERLAVPEPCPLLIRALSLTTNPHVNAELSRIARKEAEPSLLAMALEVLGFQSAPVEVDFRGLVAGAPPRVAVAGLWLAHRSGSSSLACNLAESMLLAADAAVREAAIEVALIHGSTLALNAAREAVESGEDAPKAALLALAISGEPSDVTRLTKLARVDAHAPAALFALGFSGSALALEVCVAAMEKPRLARLAGEAFSSITGLRIAGPFSLAEARKKPGESAVPFEEDDLDADLVPGPEAELPVPVAGAVKQWWATNKSHFSPNARYLGGGPLSGPALLDAFRRGPTRRREGLGLELSIRTHNEWRVDTRHWARVQLAKQAAEPRPPVMSPFGGFFE